MEPTITFTTATVKALLARLRLAIRLGQVWLIQRIRALLMLNDGLGTYSIACRLGVSTTTIYAWRDAFLVTRWQRVTRRIASGRPPKLTLRQRVRLKELVLEGPEHAGYATGCGNAALIQDVIPRAFGQTYNVHSPSVPCSKTWAFPIRRRVSSPIIMTLMHERRGAREGGPRFCAKHAVAVPSSCLPMKQALPNGVHSGTPGPCAGISPRSKPRVNAKPTR